MNKIAIVIFLLSTALNGFAQVSTDVGVRILKAEDARRFDADLESLLRDKRDAVRRRAALAAGRIGDEQAVEPLARLLSGDSSPDVQAMAAFALGEIESITGADAILARLKDPATPDQVRARSVEAAGKIAAANAGPANEKNPKAVELGEAILDVLEREEGRGNERSVLTVRLGLTAALRARPEGADTVAALFLTNLNAGIRADAANTLSRLRAKNANPALRSMLMSDDDPVARANAARALGSAEDKDAVNMLIEAAADDDDLRVRVSAIRSLAALRDPFAVERLLTRGEKLLAAYKKPRRSSAPPEEKNELLEIATALGRLIPRTNDARTVKFLNAFREADRYRSPETEIALARVAPESYIREVQLVIEGEGYNYYVDKSRKSSANWQNLSSFVQGVGAIAPFDLPASPHIRENAISWLEGILETAGTAKYDRPSFGMALPDTIRAYAAFKAGNLSAILRAALLHQDPIVRSVAAEAIGDQPKTTETFDALRTAFTKSLITDKRENDAQLALLGAIYKLDKKASVGTLLIALNAPDYLVRRKAFELLGDKELQDLPEVLRGIADARKKNRDKLRPYSTVSGTKLGQLLNTDADYRRALSRRNGSVKAILTTTKGTFTIDVLPEDAPLTVDNFVKLAWSGYFNGVEVHRVVPNFVMQDGDPRGDGNGGPGWSIRCEINMVPYERGAVGMALSGKDTGGSQWFVTHSQQPHLDGGYTVFGRVNEKDMKIVDRIARGDKILAVRIREAASAPRRSK